MLTLDRMISVVERTELRFPLPDQTPPLPSYEACLFNLPRPEGCPEGLR